MLSLTAMTTGALLLALAIFLLAALFVARPFLLPRRRPPRQSLRQVLTAEKEALLARIRALDFDAQTGKQDEEVYAVERQALLDRTAAVLQELDGLSAEPVEQQITAAIEALRRRAGESRFCPHCGQPTRPGDRFCASCGEKLA